jgi:hypothetical protein
MKLEAHKNGKLKFSIPENSNGETLLFVWGVPPGM